MAEVLGRTSSPTTEDYGSQLAEIVAYPKGRTQRIEANLAAIETLEELWGSRTAPTHAPQQLRSLRSRFIHTILGHRAIRLRKASSRSG